MKKTVGRKKKAAVDVQGDAPVEKKLGVFDFISAVSFDKIDLIRNADDPDATAKLYSPFMTNRALSFHISSIIDANIMNECSQLDPQLQFDYHLNSIRREKRFSKWFKPEANEDLDLICTHYSCNKRRAQEYLSILSGEQIEEIRALYNTGGVKR